MKSFGKFIKQLKNLQKIVFTLQRNISLQAQMYIYS